MMDTETARRLVLQFLAKQPSFGQGVNDQVLDIERSVAGKVASWADQDKSKIHEVIWDLIIQRVLTVESKGTYQWAFLRLTDFGREIVKEQQWSPYDPDGYLKELFRQAPKLGKLCDMYAAEALKCFRSNCNLATVVMLGAASEGVVNELFRRFVAALKAGNVSEALGVEKKIERQQSVYRKYEEFRKHFDSLVRPKLPPELGDDLNLQFDGVFNLIRFYRNDAGHPTGTQIERMSAFTSLVLFVPYCKRVENLINWLEANAGTLNK